MFTVVRHKNSFSVHPLYIYNTRYVVSQLKFFRAVAEYLHCRCYSALLNGNPSHSMMHIDMLVNILDSGGCGSPQYLNGLHCLFSMS